MWGQRLEPDWVAFSLELPSSFTLVDCTNIFISMCAFMGEVMESPEIDRNNYIFSQDLGNT